MNRLLTGIGVSKFDSEENLSCPFNSNISDICIASFSSMAIDKRKKAECCGTENYDNCPVFLSKVLRRR
jgi:hypothetical protein